MTRLPQKAAPRLEEFTDIARRMLSHAPSPALMLRAVLDAATSSQREYPDWRDRLEDIEQLAVFAESAASVSSFLADLSSHHEMFSGRDKDDGERRRIVLSTVHQAKGLEWDTVFIIHLVDNAFPHRRAMAEEGASKKSAACFTWP